MRTTHVGRLLVGGVLLGFSSAAHADVLMDQMDMIHRRIYEWMYGNAIGGDYLGDDGCFATQFCDDFETTVTGYILTQVEVGNLFLEDHYDVTDARVSIYADLGGFPSEEPVYSMRVSEMAARSPIAPLGIVNADFFDDAWRQHFGVWTTITGLWIPLEPETRYFICIQVDSGEEDWAFTCIERDSEIGADSFVRDGPPEEGCAGQGWFHTDWRAVGSFHSPSTSAYRVVAVGEARPKPADFNRDGAVTAADLLEFARAWSARGVDEDGDGSTTASDLVRFVDEWSSSTAPNSQCAE
jgi:hypothetical protein